MIAPYIGDGSPVARRPSPRACGTTMRRSAESTGCCCTNSYDGSALSVALAAKDAYHFVGSPGL